MKIFLNVPFSEKDEAKALGAKWDSSEKKWYAPNGEQSLIDRWPSNGKDWPKREYSLELNEWATQFMGNFPKYKFKFSRKALSTCLFSSILITALFLLVSKMGWVVKNTSIKVKEKVTTQLNISASISVQKKIKSVQKKPKQEKTDNQGKKPKKILDKKIDPELKSMVEFINSRKAHNL